MLELVDDTDDLEVMDLPGRHVGVKSFVRQN